jgi:hypothetical protein
VGDFVNPGFGDLAQRALHYLPEKAFSRHTCGK